MKKFQDHVCAIFPKTGKGAGFETVQQLSDENYIYRTTRGIVETPHGYVQAFSHFYSINQYQGSSLSIIKDGKQYHRFFEIEYQQKTLVTEAKRFAAAVFKGKTGGAA